MTTTIQFWDEDQSLILFDLNDPTGTNAADNAYTATYIKGDVDFGSPAWEFDRFSPKAREGGYTTFRRAGMRQMTVPLAIKASSYDNYRTAVGRLAQLCALGGQLRFIADGSSTTLYYDLEPSETPFMFDGRALSLFEAMRLFGLGEGVKLSLVAQPWPRGSKLASDSNKMANPTLLRDDDDDGRPTSWAWSSSANISNETIYARDEAFRFDIATSAQRALNQNTLAASAAPGDVWTLSGYARVTSTAFT
ncbi:MAG: hypothetical protein ACREER_13275, partial [Alphaproteobacteria bacterium]